MLTSNPTTISTVRDFLRVAGDDSHGRLRREIINAHPWIRRLTGPHPHSMLRLISLVVAHLIIAYLLRDAALWVTLLAAYGGGAFLAASTREAGHALIMHSLHVGN
jgi:hypothetical protein